MKTIETTNKIPTTMTMTVNAVWNEDKKVVEYIDICFVDFMPCGMWQQDTTKAGSFHSGRL